MKENLVVLGRYKKNLGGQDITFKQRDEASSRNVGQITYDGRHAFFKSNSEQI